MADANFVQSSFLGGERSKYSQGRIEDPEYRTSMNVSYNGFPLEEGAWVRRPGTKDLGPTKSGNPGKIIDFHFTGSSPAALELTDGYLRFFTSLGLVVQADYASVVAVSNANPAEITLDVTRSSWATGDTVIFYPSGASANTGASELLSWPYLITVVDSSHFTLTNAITGVDLDGTSLDFGQQLFYVGKVHEYTTNYTGTGWKYVRTIQSDGELTLLHPGTKPTVVTPMFQGVGYGLAGIPPSFAYGDAEFVDGPYLDPQNGIVATPSTTTGNVTLTLSYATYSSTTTYNAGDVAVSGITVYVSLVDSNRGNSPASSPAYWQSITGSIAPHHRGFASTDVGRHIRLWTAPADWDVAHAYSAGDLVTYDNGYYQALASSTGVVPDTDDTKWGAVSGASYARWTWGVITAYSSETSATVNIRGDDLLNTNGITLWRFGLYSDTTGWPTCGCYHEGRLWLGGLLSNRFDASEANGNIYKFSPTEPDGTVTDNSAIAYELNSSEVNPVLWMHPNERGIMMGTKENEWLISASQLSDPLTPTSIQAKRGSKHGSYGAEAVGVGEDVLFIQKHQRDVMDLTPDVFSGRYSAKNIARNYKHKTKPGLVELAYQQVLTPIVWARTTDNKLLGCTYKHEATYGREPTNFNGWHHHALGSGRSVTSISAGPSQGGDLESLMMITGPASGDTDTSYHVEMLTDIFDEAGVAQDAWFLDSAVVPPLANVTSTGVEFSGLDHMNGKTVTAFVAGLDCGEYTVASGKITVPFQSDPDQLFTAAFAAANVSTVYSLSAGTTVQQTIPDISSGIYLTDMPLSGAYFIGAKNRHVDWGNNELYTWSSSGVSVSNATTGDLIRTHATTIPNQTVGFGDTNDDYFYACLDNYANGTFAKISKATLTVTNSETVNTASMNTPMFAFGNTYSRMAFGTNYYGKGRIFWQTYKTLASIDDAMNVTVTPHEQFVRYTPGSTAPAEYGVQTRGKVVTNGYTSTGECFETTLNSGLTTMTATKYSLRTALNINGAEVPSGPNLAVTVLGYVVTAVLTYYLGPLGTILGSFITSILGSLFGGGSGPTAEFVDTFTTSTLATFAPTDIDASWTAFASIAAGVADEKDNGLILLVSGTGGGNANYVVKISSVDGTIQWKTAFPSNFMAYGYQLECKDRGLVLMSDNVGDNYVYIFDTRDGTYTSQATIGGLTLQSMAYSDQFGKIWLYTQYTNAGSNLPTVLPAGTGSFGPNFALLSTGPALAYPVTQIDPGGGGTPYVILEGDPQGVSAIVGYKYTSDGQLLRPMSPVDSGARNGPAFAKTRRAHQFAVLLQSSQSVSFGTDFSSSRLHPAQFRSPGDTAYKSNELYSGVYWDTVDDDYSFDSMLCWRSTSAYPLNVLAIGGFLHTQDR